MKKSILLAALVVGAGVATSHAGVEFGVNFQAGRGGYGVVEYRSEDCARPSYGAAWAEPTYRVIPPTPAACETEASYPDLRGEHRELHWDLREQHAAEHRALRAEHEAVHRQLRRERYMGVPSRIRRAQHDAAVSVIRDQHRATHDALQDEHRDGHEYLGW